MYQRTTDCGPRNFYRLIKLYYDSVWVHQITWADYNSRHVGQVIGGPVNYKRRPHLRCVELAFVPAF